MKRTLCDWRMNTNDKCPHCGAFVEDQFAYACGTWVGLPQSKLCLERATRQKVEAELAEANKHLNDYRAICFKQHSATVAAKETEKQLAETKEQLENLRSELAAIHATSESEMLQSMGADLGAEQARNLQLHDQLAETRKELEKLRAKHARLKEAHDYLERLVCGIRSTEAKEGK